MSGNSITLKNVSELEGMQFYIPSYQRCYRWTEQEVTDLLNDIFEYSPTDNGFYCMQPLVVKERSGDIFSEIKNNARNLEDVKHMLRGRWEVIDGQQRLTTIFIILKGLKHKTLWQLEYETRSESSAFLNNIRNSEQSHSPQDNIDFYHMFKAFQTVTRWLEHKRTTDANFSEEQYADKIRNKLKFIWYESVDENPIRVFTRLNIGKISLTNAELIKALLLKSSNYQTQDVELRQQQIAVQWDDIEYTLQSDDFWLFLNQPGYDKPTRIDLIFELVKDKDLLGLKYRDNNELCEKIGTDGYATFRYFYEFFRNDNGSLTAEQCLEKCWEEVKRIFSTFREWFNDIELYHYVGYLVDNNTKLSDLLDDWNSATDKTSFINNNLIERIKRTISKCKDLDKQYEINNGSPKTQCRPLLLLHNVQSIINQANNSKEKYGERMFLKFPFHLYKTENWDVEHIDSDTENQLETEKHRKEWLLYSMLDCEVSDNNDLKSQITTYLGKKDDEKYENEFQSLYEAIVKLSKNNTPLSKEDKNKIGNFVLLDSATNRGYGNAIFPVKRRIIIGKDQGKKFSVTFENDKIEVDSSKKADSAFIPPCTKYAFMKYYNINSSSIKYWDSNDAEYYRRDILETLKNFGVIDSAKDKNANNSEPKNIEENNE